MRDLRWTVTRCLALGATLVLVPLGAASCAATPEDPAGQEDGPEPNGALENGVSFETVAKAVAGSCTTASVKGLSQQIIAQGQCLEPAAYAEVPDVSAAGLVPRIRRLICGLAQVVHRGGVAALVRGGDEVEMG